MRCYLCDWCPTAPSISTLNETKYRKLQWDESVKGWTCGSQCSYENSLDTIEDLLDNLDVETTKSEDEVSSLPIK